MTDRPGAGPELGVIAAAWAHRWGMPVGVRDGRFALDLSRGGLCGWLMSASAGRRVLAVLEVDGFRPAIVALDEGQWLLIGTARGIPEPGARAVLAETGVRCLEGGVIPMPDPEAQNWISVPSSRKPLPGMPDVLTAVSLAAPVR